MCSRIILALSVVTAFSFGTWAFSRAPHELHTLTVAVEEVSNSAGVVGVLVFNSAAGWPEDFSAALRGKSTPAHPGVMEITFPGLSAGDYAVVVLHDENGNKKLDRGLLGIPIEQWGMSNNPSYSLSAPSFDSARFRLEGDERISVRLH